jgi:hypothetical protein
LAVPRAGDEDPYSPPQAAYDYMHRRGQVNFTRPERVPDIDLRDLGIDPEGESTGAAEPTVLDQVTITPPDLAATEVTTTEPQPAAPVVPNATLESAVPAAAAAAPAPAAAAKPMSRRARRDLEKRQREAKRQAARAAKRAGKSA